MQMPIIPAEGPKPTHTRISRTQMMEGIARRKVSTAESTAAIHLKGVRFLARNTAKTIPPTRLYTVERMATAMDSDREVKVTSIWLKSTLHSLPMASGMRRTPSHTWAQSRSIKNRAATPKMVNRDRNHFRARSRAGSFTRMRPLLSRRSRPFFSAGSSTAEPATG